ncbi:MAG: exodeoxyribonuclease III [Chlorobi bacterium]|nr:exodeoxyribonuclease III [Chlorobiota bacterium]
MKIVTYNVNGIRAALRKGMGSWLADVRPDILCLQEIKASHEHIDREFFRRLGYEYQYWFPAERKGYSGTAILSRPAPRRTETGSGIPFMDREGRIITADFGAFALMNVYVPSGHRLRIKFDFMDAFYAFTRRTLERYPNLVVCGDFNICHQPRDIHDPVRLKRVSGFLPEERAWLTAYMDLGLADTFRLFDDRPGQYTWWSYRQNSRARNKGWRLDYHLASLPLVPAVKRTVILRDVPFSDHVPVLMELDAAALSGRTR